MSHSAQPTPPVIVVQLVHIEGPLKGQIQEFDQPIVTIGRDPKGSVIFPPALKAISRHHAEIRREGNRFKLIDRSTNGTFVRGKRVEEIYLTDGDVIAFSESGPKVSFLSVIREPAAASPEPAAPYVAPQPPPGPVTLTVQYGPTLKTYNQASLRMGSDPSCDVVVDLPGVAPRHAEVSYGQNFFWVKDLTSEGRTLLNSRPLIQPTVLREGDMVQLGTSGPAFVYSGVGKLLQREIASPPPSPPVRPPEPSPRVEPRPASPQWKRPEPRRGTASRMGPMGTGVPVWIWIAAGSAAVVALVVYLVAKWAAG